MLSVYSVISCKIRIVLGFHCNKGNGSGENLIFAASQPTLIAANLVSVPSAEAAAAWDDLFSVLEKYGQHLSALTGADSTRGTENSILALARQFNDTADKLKHERLISKSPEISANLATGFTEVARLILRAHAQAEARKILLNTDSTMAGVFTGLAEAIGATSKDGLRHLISAHWDQRKVEKQGAFLSANPAERRRLTLEFSELLDAREIQDLALTALRRSILALADAHHAVARGREVSLGEAVGVITLELKHARELQNQLKTKLNPNP